MIVFVHLLNDRSGSPRVLNSIIRGLTSNGYKSVLYVGSGSCGHLDDSDVETKKYWYRRTPWRPITLLTFLISQITLFVRLLLDRTIPREAKIYVNTLLPFGAAVYGKITKRPVIYHLHEVSVSPAPLRIFLLAIVRLTASRLIYVSNFHRNSLPLGSIPFKIARNGLSTDFLSRAVAPSEYRPTKERDFIVLMLSALRDYKGVPEFFRLADRLSGKSRIRFWLVANDERSDIEKYVAKAAPPENVQIFFRTNTPSDYYKNADLVVNFSRVDRCQETFGLTLLEAMAHGVPVIAPPVGGPPEFVRHGENGFLLDSREVERLAEVVESLANDPETCALLSENARFTARQHNFQRFLEEIEESIRS